MDKIFEQEAGSTDPDTVSRAVFNRSYKTLSTMAVDLARGADLAPSDYDTVKSLLNVAECLVKESAYVPNALEAFEAVARNTVGEMKLKSLVGIANHVDELSDTGDRIALCGFVEGSVVRGSELARLANSKRCHLEADLRAEAAQPECRGKKVLDPKFTV